MVNTARQKIYARNDDVFVPYDHCRLHVLGDYECDPHPKEKRARLQGLSKSNDQKFGDALEVSKRQLAVAEQMLEELRSIRRQLEHKDK